MTQHKTMNVSLENYQRLQRCGFGGESMNDVIRRVLTIVEPQIATQLQRSETIQKAAKYQEDYQKRVAEVLSKQEAGKK